MGISKKKRPAAGLLVGLLMLMHPASGLCEPPKGPQENFIVRTDESKAPELWKSQAFDGLFIGMTAADLKNDGSHELFLLSKNKLIIAKRGRDRLEVIKEIKPAGGTDNVAIATFGRAVYVSAIFDNRPYGYAVEFRDNDYRVTAAGIGWLMRSSVVPGSPPALVGQRFRKPDGFYGELRALGREGEVIVDKGPFMKLPRGVDIYRFDILKSNADKEIITLNDRDYLRLYVKSGDSWEKTWGSDDYYGGTLNYINFREDRPDEEEAPVAVEGRFSQIDLDKDGLTELIVKKNMTSALGRFMETPSFDRGEVVSLVWDGHNFTEKWRTKEVKGYVSDFMIEDDGGERRITMLIVEGVKAITGGSPKSYILSYRFSI